MLAEDESLAAADQRKAKLRARKLAAYKQYLRNQIRQARKRELVKLAADFFIDEKLLRQDKTKYEKMEGEKLRQKMEVRKEASRNMASTFLAIRDRKMKTEEEKNLEAKSIDDLAAKFKAEQAIKVKNRKELLKKLQQINLESAAKTSKQKKLERDTEISLE